jgi:cutinase
MGMSVGPSLKGALSSSWHVEGIDYDASMLGDYCVGLPGGVQCKKQLEALVTKCPNTKVVTSGYSQGAMVARICAAFASETAKKRIAVNLSISYSINVTKHY